MSELKIGDVVVLKSGGPKMTINNVAVGISGEEVACAWFEGKKRQVAAFMPAALRPATQEDE